jgi:glycosyltransferase involved in cell wall biosynthesis
MTRVTVLDMQPITPAVGGGRMRLLGLYHALGANLPVTYVGTYDWPGEAAADRQLTPTLREITVPLTKEHFAEDARVRAEVGKTVIDTAFHRYAHLSPAYVERTVAAVREADVVVFSHPWVYPLATDAIDSRRQVVVYDAQNVEGMLRTKLLDDGARGTEIALEVIRIEKELCEAADLILACSQEDREQFHELYGIARQKIKICPNGVFTGRICPATETERRYARERLGIRHPHAAIFVGSPYAFNTEAARFIVEELAPQLPSVMFVVAGGVGATLKPATLSNVRITNLIPEEELNRYLAACDLALNPMFGGSGTNVKMFAYCAAGLPIVTTATGARGIDTPGLQPFLTASPHEFPAQIKLFTANERLRKEFGRLARRLAIEQYSWERISPNTGILLEKAARRHGRTQAEASVIVEIGTAEDLPPMLEALAAQTVQDFETIVVDRGSGPSLEYRMPRDGSCSYIRGRTADAVFLAQGRTLAFLEGHQQPFRKWLEGGLDYLRKPGRVAASAPDGRNLFVEHDTYLAGQTGSAYQVFRAVDLAAPTRQASGKTTVDAADWVGIPDEEFVRKTVLAFTGFQADAELVESTVRALASGECRKSDFLQRLTSNGGPEWAPLLPDIFENERIRMVSLERLLQYPGTDEEFTRYVYREILGRAADEEAVANCCRLLGSGEMTRGELVQLIAESEEFRNSHAAVLGVSHVMPEGRPGTIWRRG